MYKITLYDENCWAACDGVISFFTEDLEDFQRLWFERERDDDTKARFLKSKAGEIVTDYYSHDPDLNIVQEDQNTTILTEKVFYVKNQTFTLENAYGCESKFYVKEGENHYRWITFKDDFYRIASYSLKGDCLDDIEILWTSTINYGNQILEIDKKVDARRRPKEDFCENTTRTYCFKSMERYSDRSEWEQNAKIFMPDEMEYIILFADIVGEGG